MDSITNADGMGDTRLVHFPGSVRVCLGDDAIALIADALEVAANEWGPGDGDKAVLLTEVLRASDGMSVELCTSPHHEDYDPAPARAMRPWPGSS